MDSRDKIEHIDLDDNRWNQEFRAWCKDTDDKTHVNNLIQRIESSTYKVIAFRMKKRGSDWLLLIGSGFFRREKKKREQGNELVILPNIGFYLSLEETEVIIQ
jgi:hypothetical protein